MKNLLIIIGLTLSLGTIAKAQATKKVSANIPFDFYIQNQKMEAGEYIIEAATPNSDRGNLIVRQKKGKAKKMFMTLPATSGGDARSIEISLIFNKYGNSYFLAKVLNPLENLGLEITKARAEKYLARKGRSEQLTVAANVTPR